MRRKTALTFIAHGSRVAEANQFQIQQIQNLPIDLPRNLGFLEAAQPSIREAIEEHIRNGFDQITVMPLFLAPGRHVMEDIPRLVTEVRQAHSGVEIQLTDFLAASGAYSQALLAWVKKTQ